MTDEKLFQINHESLNQAIEDFNASNLISVLVFNKESNSFEVECFANQVDRSTTIFVGQSIPLYEKGEFEESSVIGESETHTIMRRLKDLQKGLTVNESIERGNWYE